MLGLDPRYKIITRIATGGMAQVFLANDTYNNKQVAIKMLLPEKESDAVALRRMAREIDLTAKVNSDYVVRILDYKMDDDAQYIVMEHVEGKTLQELIKFQTRLNIDLAITITHDIACGLEAIHAAGIVHRDIKPLNILVTEDHTAKIIDFGISLTSGATQLTKLNSVVGSAHYMAPELFDHDNPTPTVDVYALGILLFEMLAGQQPFSGNDYKVIARKHRNSNLPNIRRFNCNVPQTVANIIKRATAKNPSERFENVSEMITELKTATSASKLNVKPFLLKSERRPKTLTFYLSHHWFWPVVLGALFLVTTVTTVLLLVFT